MSNLSSLLERSVQNFPDRTAVVLGATRLTYAQLDQQAALAAGWLRAQGIGPGDPVVLSLPNVPAFAVATALLLESRARLRRRMAEAGQTVPSWGEVWRSGRWRRL